MQFTVLRWACHLRVVRWWNGGGGGLLCPGRFGARRISTMTVQHGTKTLSKASMAISYFNGQVRGAIEDCDRSLIFRKRQLGVHHYRLASFYHRQHLCATMPHHRTCVPFLASLTVRHA